jgi:hypothetical protein
MRTVFTAAKDWDHGDHVLDDATYHCQVGITRHDEWPAWPLRQQKTESGWID